MTASDFAGGIAVALIAACALVTGWAPESPLSRALDVAAVIYIVRFFWKGHSLKGWIGDSYHEMYEEIGRLSRISAKWEYSDGTPVPVDQRAKILNRCDQLRDKIQFHPDNPRNR